MLPRSYTRAIAQKAADRLIESGAAICSDRDKLVHFLEKALLEELLIEKKLIEEALTLISAHRGSVRAEGADVDALRDKIVAKLAKERGVVLR